MKKKLALLFGYLFIGIGLITAQTQKVTGTVISDDDKQPVVGASIVVKGTNLGHRRAFHIIECAKFSKNIANLLYRYENGVGFCSADC